MSTLGHHPQHLRVLILTEADGADAIGSGHGFIPGEGEFRVRVNDSLVEAKDAVIIVGIWRGVVLGDEDDLRENDSGIGTRGSGVAVEIAGAGAGAGGATADVEGEKKSGEEDEEGEGYGNGVAEADLREGVIGRGGGGRRGDGH